MKRLLVILGVLAGLGVIAWGAGAMVAQTAATRWLEARSADGWVAHAAEVSVTGFPLDLETVFTGIELADPETGLAWSAPAFRIQQHVFRLDRVTAHWPETQTIASPAERLTLSSNAMFAHLDVQPASRFALDDVRGGVASLAVSSSAGWTMSMAQAALSATRVPGTDQVYDVNLTATQMVPPDAWRDRLDPGGLLPEAMTRAIADTTITFDLPWDMDAIEVARPQISLLEVDEINAAWGDMLFRASGTLQVTPGGIPEGDLAVRAENWRAMVDLAENAGALPARLRPTAEAMLEMLAGINGSAENIDATLTFSNGRVFIGPLPLGSAPSLRLR